MQNRIYLWDNLKFLLITTVVLGHFADVFTGVSSPCRSLFAFIYAFHMPLFLYVSGLFHKNTNIGKKVLFDISIGFFIKFLLLCTGVLNGNAPKFSLLGDIDIPWFMFSLAACTLLTYWLKNQNKWYVLVFAVFVACLVGYDKTISDYLYLSRTVVFFPFYWLGNITNPERVAVFKEKQKVLKIVAALLIVALWLYVAFAAEEFIYEFRHLFTGRNPFSKFVYSYGPFARLLCYAIATLMGGALVILTPSRKLPLISKMGTRTIDVLIWHWPMYLVLEKYFHLSAMYTTLIGKIAFLLSAVVLTAVLSLGGPFQYPTRWIKNSIFNVKRSQKNTAE